MQYGLPTNIDRDYLLHEFATSMQGNLQKKIQYSGVLVQFFLKTTTSTFIIPIQVQYHWQPSTTSIITRNPKHQNTQC
jgi:hypothetical protein